MIIDKLEQIEQQFKKTGEDLRKYGDSPQARSEIYGDFYGLVKRILEDENE